MYITISCQWASEKNDRNNILPDKNRYKYDHLMDLGYKTVMNAVVKRSNGFCMADIISFQ